MAELFYSIPRADAKRIAKKAQCGINPLENWSPTAPFQDLGKGRIRVQYDESQARRFGGWRQIIVDEVNKINDKFITYGGNDFVPSKQDRE